MGRCYICDYSQSADSSYHSGLQLHHTVDANRVIYNRKLGKDICIQCTEDALYAANYWTDIDGSNEVFNAYIPDDGEAPAEYAGCTDKPSD